MKLHLFTVAAALALVLSHPGRAADRGVVVSAHSLASEAGVRVLRNGGNAFDAAVATGLALAVVHPTAGNIGGGGFLVAVRANGDAVAVDFREKAPAAATAGLFLDPEGKLIPGSNHTGHRAVGVPGTVAGFDLILKKWGRKGWADVAAPAVGLAQDGFPLTAAMAAEFAAHRDDWKTNPPAARIFLKPDGSAFAKGHLWKQPDLARTLQRLAERGRDGFYQGETAAALAADMKAHGGLITEADLAAYEARERPPIRGAYRDVAIVSMPPPSSGGIALVEMLNMLEGDDLAALGHNSPAYVHLLAESMRRAFADRARYLGDPDFNPDLPVATLTSKEHARRHRQTIHPAKASASDPGRFTEAYESPETTHYSVLDAEGNAVVVTYTLEQAYGAKIVADGLGFLYNNEMGDFNPQPGRTDATGLIGTPANLIAPGKRMLSSMTPTIVLKDGKPWLLVGSPGGRTIINTVLQVVLNVVDFRLPLPEAVAAPRLHHQWLPDEIVGEARLLTPDLASALREKGHTVKTGGKQGRVMAILIDPGTGKPTAVADPRDPDGAAAQE